MFSVRYTGTNFLPLCTASVWPTISGTTVERRDQVLTTFFSFARFIASTFSRRCVSTNGPFFNERLINSQLSALSNQQLAIGHRYLERRCTMNLSLGCGRRVLYPFVGTPHGVTGWRPPEVLPS